MDKKTSPSQEDEIIDLVNMVEEEEETIELTEPLEESSGSKETEDFIDLTDAAEEAAAPQPDDFDIPEHEPEFEMDRLPEEALSVQEPTSDKTGDDLSYDDGFDDETVRSEDADDFVHSLGMELDSELDAAGEAVALGSKNTPAASLSPEQIEAAVERVLVRILPDRIESILVETIERVVSQEIKKVKRDLLEE